MPKGKQSVSALGKSWSMVDIDNLQKAADMLTQLNNLLDNFADSSSKDVENWINKKQKIINSLEGMSIKIKTEGARIDENSLKAMQKEANEALVLLNILKQQNEQLEKAQKTTQKTVRQRQQERAEEARRLKQEQLNKQGPKFKNYGILNWGSYVRDKGIFNLQEKVLNNETKAILKRLQDKGHNIEESKVREIAERRLEEDRLKSPEAKKANKNRDDANKKLGLAGEVLNEAGKLLSNVAKKFMDLFFSGAQKQVDAYNNTYDSVAARLNINRDTYRSQWTSVNRNIKAAGLTNNIGTSEVMQQWDTLAKTGVGEAQVFETALDTVITQKIVPYLDTTADEFSIINGRLDNNFVKDIRGINKVNSQIAGNNYATNDLLKKIISEVQPMSDEALQNLAQGSAELTSFVNQLTPIIGKDAAQEYANQIFKMQNYGDEILQSESPAERLAYIDALANPETQNVYNAENWATIAGNIADRRIQLMNSSLGFNSTYGGLESLIVGRAMIGKDSSTIRAVSTLKEQNISGASLAANAKKAGDNLIAAGQEETENLANDFYNTEKEMQELTMENISTEMAQIQAKMGVVGDLIVDAIKNIGTILITKIFTDGIGNIASMIGGVGGKGLAGAGGIAGSLGSVATGLALMALPIVAIKGSLDAYNRSQQEFNERVASEATNYGSKYSKKAAGAQGQQGAGAIDAAAAEMKTRLRDENGNEVALSNANPTIGLPKVFSGEISYGDYMKAQGAALGTFMEHPVQNFGKMLKYSREDTFGYYTFHKTPNDYNKAILEGKLQTGNYTSDQLRALYSAYVYAILSAGNDPSSLSQIMPGGNTFSVEGVKTILHDLDKDINPGYDWQGIKDGLNRLYDSQHPEDPNGDGMTNEWIQDNWPAWKFMMQGNQLLANNDLYPMGPNDNFYNGILSGADLHKFGLYRQGLDSVPYDNFPALLHENEAILTASTANELRNLVSEYRDSKQQAYNFETIIQDQTITLCSKIDELIRVVQSGDSNTFSDLDNATKNSMKKMKSVFSLLQ